MSYEKECSTCKNFKHTGPSDRGTCEIGERGGITYGRYGCRWWIGANPGRVSNTVYRSEPKTGHGDDKRNKKSDSDVGDIVQADELRNKRDIKELNHLNKKGLDYGNNA